ncbi:MAG: ABC transporter ATP-binding protein [Candidatus Thorarchaeota archaeon]|nr:ABC transporter ATP-binding protein [Candidatus Thorarchaeota archaeon]
MDNAIDIKNVSFSYNEFTMREISLQLKRGELRAIAGLNGSGKTTLFRLIVGLLFPDSGSITVMGRTVTQENLWRVRQEIGFLFQNPENQLFAPTVWEDIAFGPKNQGLTHEQIVERVESALDLVDMVGYSERSIHELSHGQAKRVALAGILAMKPRILLLDEPFSGLDNPMVVQLVKLVHDLRKQCISVMYTTHNQFYFENWADSLTILHEGNVIFDGEPETALTSEEVLDTIGDWESLSQTLRNASKHL